MIAQMQEALFPNADAAPSRTAKQAELEKKRAAILAAQGHRDSPVKTRAAEDETDEQQLADVKKQEQRRRLKETMLRQQQRRRTKGSMRDSSAGAPSED